MAASGSQNRTYDAVNFQQYDGIEPEEEQVPPRTVTQSTTPVAKRLRQTAGKRIANEMQELRANDTAYGRLLSDMKNTIPVISHLLCDADPLKIQSLKQTYAVGCEESQRLESYYESVQDSTTFKQSEIHKILMKINRLSVLSQVLSRMAQTGNLLRYIRTHIANILAIFDKQSPVPSSDFFLQGGDSDSDNDDEPIQQADEPKDTAHEEDPDKRQYPYRSHKRVAPDPSGTSTPAKKCCTNANCTNSNQANDTPETTPSTIHDPEETNDAALRTMNDTMRRKIAERKQRILFVRAGADPDLEPLVPPSEPKVPNYTGPLKEVMTALEQLSPGNPALVDIAASLGKYSASTAKETAEDTLRKAQQHCHQPTVKLPPGYYQAKMTDTFDKTRKPFRKYFNDLGLDKFSGEQDSIAFLPWWNAFLDQVHKLPLTYAPDREKLLALVKCLSGNAEQLVKSWVNSPSPQAYEKAVASLMARFGNNAYAREQAVEAIRSTKPTSMKPSALMTYLTTINSNRQALANTGTTIREASLEAMRAVSKTMIDQVDKYLMAIGQFSSNTSEEFFIEDPDTSFDGFFQWFVSRSSRYQIETDPDDEDSGILDDSAATFTTQVSRPSSSSAGKRPIYTTPTKHKFNTASSDQNRHRQRSFKCAFCSKAHQHDSCPMDLNARHATAEKLGLCKCCVKAGHTAKECKSDLTCIYCAMKNEWKRHNSALCRSEHAMKMRKLGIGLDWKKYHELRDKSQKYQESDLAKKSKSSKPKPKFTPKAFAAFLNSLMTNAQPESESESDEDLNDADLQPLPEQEESVEKEPEEEDTETKSKKD